MKSSEKSLIDLTWDDLRLWAGGKILNRGKSYIRNVSGLTRTDDGGWTAWVAGSEDYAAFVEADGHGEINWHCTCPFDWGPCKHAVAVILAGIEEVKAGREIPVLDEESDLSLALWEDPDEFDDFHDEDDADNEEPERNSNGSGVEKILQNKSREDLFNMLIDIASRHPEIKRGIMEREQLACGQVDKLVRALRREIRNVTGEDAWYSYWNSEGNLPDYSHIRQQLTALLKNGHADTVLELGRELWERGSDQVEQSDDDGHTAGELHQCMEIVFKAITSSSLSAPKQLLMMIDIFLEDEFSICDSLERFVRRREYSKAHWRKVSEQLQRRLAAMPNSNKGAGFSDRYRRGHLMDWLVDAYERSGQPEKIIPLFEEEVHATQCYEKLVKAYLDHGRSEGARSWCIKGFAETIKDMPGIAHGLRDTLREMAVKEKKFDLVASYRAEEFFERPCRASYLKLQKAAGKIKLWPEVRTAALRFLEDGERPDPSAKKKKNFDWPLPPPEVKGKTISRPRDRYPDLDTLIDIAILEKRFDDVVRLYRERQKGNRWGLGMGEEVADAVADSHPDIALDIWKQIVVGKIKLVKPREYEEAAVYLRKMRKVYQKTKRTGEWRTLIVSLRTEHKAKRRLMEVLDSLEGKRIID
ncbi:MAG: SWIM zinc finger family protein [Desulfobulbales bacterium]|nr:SWIM zinc finger family protein [Desulfobulbales bacterium]